jgi:hypothetical protein
MRAVAVLLAFVIGCGPSYPPRFVLERDVGRLSYRRYQRVLDVEFPVEGNDAVGHTATYVRRTGGRDVPFVTVFVTVYDHAEGLASVVRRQARSLGSYEVRVVDEGGRAFLLDGGPGDTWYLWVSSNHVVKVGGAAPNDWVRQVVREYMHTYSSDLDEHGRARAGAASAGEVEASSGEAPASEVEMELPRSLSNGGDEE